MTRYLVMLLAGVAACDPGATIGPAPDELPPPEPGLRLPFAAPQSDGLFPQIAWDTNAGLFLPEHPNTAPTTLVRFGLADGATTALERVNGGLEVIASGGGSVFYTQPMRTSEVVSRVGGEDLGPVSAVHFAVSRNGKWLVLRDEGWWILDVERGTRRAVPVIPEFRQPIGIDDGGTQVAFGLVGPLSEFDPSITLADVTAGTTRDLTIPGQRLLAVEFIGDRPLLFGFAAENSAAGTDLRFLTKTDLEGSMRFVGTVHVTAPDDFVGVCGAWSTAAGYGVGVVQVRFSGARRARHEIVKLDTAAHVIGSADLLAPTDCTLSPDGKWFVYGNATGYIGIGELYLKSVR